MNFKNQIDKDIRTVEKRSQLDKTLKQKTWYNKTDFLITRYKENLSNDSPEINVDLKVLLTSEYPKVCPRCFAEEKIVNYCGKIFLKNIWEQEGKKYVMICHEHMSNTNAWKENLGIAHFFIGQVWVWWAAQQNVIIKEYDKKK